MTARDRDHAAEKLAEHVARAIAQAPPLTEAQRRRIAAILSGTSAEQNGGAA